MKQHKHACRHTHKHTNAHKHAQTSRHNRADEEKRAKEVAEAGFRALLERSGLKASSSWRKVQAKLQDQPEYEVRMRCESASA